MFILIMSPKSELASICFCCFSIIINKERYNIILRNVIICYIIMYCDYNGREDYAREHVA